MNRTCLLILAAAAASACAPRPRMRGDDLQTLIGCEERGASWPALLGRRAAATSGPTTPVKSAGGASRIQR
jgi:hypothetical protein